MKIKDAAPVQDSRKQQLLEDIARTKSALDRAYSNFENVIDPDLIDSSIYGINSLLSSYEIPVRAGMNFVSLLTSGILGFSGISLLYAILALRLL